MKLTFLGATDTVTGSRFLLEHSASKVLVDCGLFQGLKRLRLRNWNRFPVDPADLDAVVLTHAHIDHSGYIPRLVSDGFRGPVYCTDATLALCEILLPDSGRLQEEEAAYANRKKFSRHKPARPLYTEQEARTALESFNPLPFGLEFDPAPGITGRFQPAGHILGAAWVALSDRDRRVTFSGDLGRFDDPVMYPPSPLGKTDYLVTESTYGDRPHPCSDAVAELADVINATAERGGTVLIPSFAVGRAQILLHLITGLVDSNRVPSLPVYLDSPMAINATEVFCRYHEQHRLSDDACNRMCAVATYARSADESRTAMFAPAPKIIVSASGMATGGRILHHLKHSLQDPDSSVVFVGFQAAGTRGAAMVAGAESVKIHGRYHPVKARVQQIDGLSAHADGDGVLRWLGTIPAAPKCTWIVHGEPAAQDAMRLRVKDELGWRARIPEYGDSVELD